MGIKAMAGVVGVLMALFGFRGLWSSPLSAVVAVTESAASPGPLTRAHAAIGGTCASCHASAFADAGDDMSARCSHCHQQIDRQASGACSTCHGEHAGPTPTLFGPHAGFHHHPS